MARRAHSYYSVQLHTDGVQYTLEWDKHTNVGTDEDPRFITVTPEVAAREVWEWINDPDNGGVIVMDLGSETRTIRSTSVAHVDVYDLDAWSIGDGS